jgi:hypothetical protein
MVELKTMVFGDLSEVLAVSGEGMIFMGCGGIPEDWINGVSEQLLKDKITTQLEVITEVGILKTTGGRTDILMVPDWNLVDSGKLAIWRIQFGDCSWLSDYVVNYASQHEAKSITSRPVRHSELFMDEDEEL